MTNDSHPVAATPLFFAYLAKSIGMPVSVYVKEIPDAMMDGTLVDFDDDYVFIQSDYSMDAWRIDALAGISVFTDSEEHDPRFEIVFNEKK